LNGRKLYITLISLQQLKDKRNKLLLDMQAIALKGFNTESRSAFDRMNTAVLEVEADLSRAETLAKFESEQRSFERSPRPSVGSAHFENKSIEERKAAWGAAFRKYGRYGLGALNEEQRALLTTSDATGGALIPQEFEGVLREAKKFYGGIANYVSQRVTNNNGAPMKISLTNDTNNGLVLLPTEGTSAPQETDMSFQSKILSVDTLTAGLIRVSFQELEDSAFDLDAFIRNAFGKRYGRGLETIVTTGKDSAGTALPNQTGGGLLGIATVGTTTGTLAAGIGWSDIVNTYGALDPAYLGPNTAWTFNAATRTYLLGLKDGFGRPFWVPDPSAAAPFSKMLGYDVVLNQSMPNMGAANGTPILFGDFSEGFVLRTDGAPSILRLNERFADTLEVGMLCFVRAGGISVDAGTHPIVSLKQAAA